MSLQLTFDGLRREQIEARWAAEIGGLEAYVFDGADLLEEERWRTLRDNLRHACELGVRRRTLHFPTEHADWVGDHAAFDMLRRFCDIAADSGAAGVTLHANQFVAQRDWRRHDLSSTRAKVVERLAKLDGHLVGAPLWIGVENMPVIGAQGVDYDSVFVRPDDFTPLLELDSPRIGVTWDVCHWAVTWSTLASVAQLRQEPAPYRPLDLPPLPIRHVHFASFSGHAMPFWPGECTEGVPPQDGDLDQELLARMLLCAVRAAPGDVGVVLEVQEEDYLSRKNCWTTLSWLDSLAELDVVRSGKEEKR